MILSMEIKSPCTIMHQLLLETARPLQMCSSYILSNKQKQTNINEAMDMMSDYVTHF